MAWLNSDDIFLPGAIGTAVAALRARPDAGAVYGEGYQIDESGNLISRFGGDAAVRLVEAAEPLRLHLAADGLFRRTIFDEIGWMNEDLHYGMDWDLLMRIGLQYPIVYVGEYMGAIREYPAAKSFSGGAKRARELARIMRSHSRKRFPLGMFVYGMPTYVAAINARIAWALRGPFAPFAMRLQRRVAALGSRIVGEILRRARGLVQRRLGGAACELQLPALRRAAPRAGCHAAPMGTDRAAATDLFDRRTLVRDRVVRPRRVSHPDHAAARGVGPAGDAPRPSQVLFSAGDRR